VMSLPMTLVGSSVAQVYLSEAPARYRDGTLGSFTRRTSLVLFGCAAPPLAFVALVAPFVFPWLLGEDWVRAGVLVAWMTPWYLLQFTASPVSVVLHVTNRIGTAMLLQAFGFLVRVGSVLAAASIATQWTPEVYAVSGAIFYGIYIVVIIRISGIQK